MHFTLIFVIHGLPMQVAERVSKFRIQGMLKCMFDDPPVSDSSCQTRILLLQRNQAVCTILTFEIYSSDRTPSMHLRK